MANLTLSIDDKLLRAARVRAVKEGTSVNEVCRRAIETYARVEEGQARVKRYLAVVAKMDAHRPKGGPLPTAWKDREEMYGQILQERHPTLLGKMGQGQALMDFLDTNILVYCHDPKDPVKRDRAETLLTGLMDSGRLALSTQVLLEFYSVVTAKRLRTAAEAEILCRLLAGFEVVPATVDLVFRAFALQQRHQISIWDAMVVQAALDAGCDTLYSEDMRHGLRFGQLQVINPFLQPAAVHEPPAPYQRGRRAAARPRGVLGTS